ncbi:guanitoxin biosynthesis L-enduracididine beta-hydroxylase GntD [Nonomuraea pusilla]|uniref:Arginine beta-hydroxylase, Fe(II)/alpha-ketoglutarate-dependent n=1 Tax=Nonomuraea pusilla TaxID=46177 RepID=A0A1H7I6A7_9ACTN|nr:guanitoxin biosynthesis L-enduracididine beta-hydroxylase GntD [Nonomuraea pusilla]SEK58069.1 arginine beta-hydroxylase, Fe(II)/alpha-ketoglutarate-dependent [Nonomuraea pusilla]
MGIVRVVDVSAEGAGLRAAIEATAERYTGVEDEDFLRGMPMLAALLPEHLVLALRRLMLEESAPVTVVRGFPVPEDLAPTPLHWRAADPAATLVPDLYLMLLGSVLGEPFGWRTLQEGRLVSSVLPIPGGEQEQTGHSSDVCLEFHGEDAFHDMRCDYLGLLCLRNPDRTPTTVGAVDLSRLPESDAAILSQPRFRLWADDELRRNSATLTGDEAATDWTGERVVRVLFGHPRAPYLRIDPAYMRGSDEPAASALRRLAERLGESLVDVVLEPGDACLIDNYRAVHGRKPFTARYDGTDRWLRRVMVTRDLRKSRALRASAPSRVIL